MVRLDGRLFRIRFDASFELNLTSVSNSIWRRFRTRFEIGFSAVYGTGVEFVKVEISGGYKTESEIFRTYRPLDKSF